LKSNWLGNPTVRRFAWLVAIYVCSVASLGLVALALRLFMHSVGFSR
jgi:hypothetical protein